MTAGDSCQSIGRGDDIDVIEIDAASNTGVDDVRDTIIGTAYNMPARSRFKIFIIDEVHMLSKSAFNALLKTLEEPPSHGEVHPGHHRAGEGAADDFVAVPAVRFPEHPQPGSGGASEADLRGRKN